MSTNGGKRLSSFFSPADVACHVKDEGREAVLKTLLCKLAYNRGIGNVDHAFQAILDRERSQSTMLMPGLVVPHARLEAIDRLAVSIATSESGIPYINGDEPVKVVVLILAPKSDPNAYLQAMSSLAKILSDAKMPETVARLNTAEEIWRFFDRGGVDLPDYVCARDLMMSDPPALLETDTLEHAIDLFDNCQLVSLPVVDADGELVGVVSSFEILRVCLPNHILWMEDLSPILHFEPFIQMLRREGKTWLAEIMSFDYVTIPEDAPAIQVAKEITRHNVREVFVTRGKRLIGMITLQQFIHKVLRE